MKFAFIHVEKALFSVTIRNQTRPLPSEELGVGDQLNGDAVPMLHVPSINVYAPLCDAGKPAR